jgi:C1A family cysteine protease
MTERGTSMEIAGMGWLPDYPDFRDYSAERGGEPPEGEDRDVPALLRELHVQSPEDPKALPTNVDLRADFPPIENQGSLGSCTANAGVGIIEYYERKAFGKHLDASRLFLYKATRNLLGWTGDTGAFLRTTMQALVLFGAPPESYWPYKITDFDKEPAAFHYSFAQRYRALQYYRLDPPNTTVQELLARIKTNVAGKLPPMFGFTVFSSYGQASDDGAFPFPTTGESVVGGHAVVVVGYDDGKSIQNQDGGPATTGAFRIRNSWGTGWGDNGYGWLPYEYVTQGLAVDWWSLIKSSWVDTKAFGL